MDADCLWLANAHAGPAAWEPVASVPHAWTDGVLVLAGRRLDPLDRARGAAAVAAGRAEPEFALAAAFGPDPIAPVRFPTTLCSLLDTATRMAGSPVRFHRPGGGRDWHDGLRLWVPLPPDAWERRGERPPDPEPVFERNWTPDEM